MKLIDLLVQELPKRGGWPENAVFAVQDNDGLVKFGGNPALVSPGHLGDKNTWQGRWNYTSCYDLLLSDVAIDWSESKIESFEYEAALAASKQPVWDGEGNPPIGVTCEHCPGGTTQTEWEVVTVLGISERPGGMFTDYWLRKEDGSSYIIGNPYRFRPIRTEAERKREEAAKSMLEVIESQKHRYSENAYMLIYDAIAAGKIPGVKLAD